jgi:hypothetical protein
MSAIETYGSTVLEIEKFVLGLDPSIRSEAFRFFVQREFEGEKPSQPQSKVPVGMPVSDSRGLSPQELLRKSGAQTMMDIATVLGYWIEIYQHEPSFSSGQLKEAFDRAREAAPANPSDVVAKLEGAGKLMRAEKIGSAQHYRLTRTAIEEIEGRIGADSIPTKSTPPSDGNSTNILVAPVDNIHVEGISARATAWMRQHQIGHADLEQVFSIETDPVEVIAATPPAESRKQQTIQAYLLCGMCAFIRTGNLTFNDSDARALCERFGCFDVGNHTNATRKFGNLIAGSKDSGWRLTNPGLHEAAQIVKNLVGN